MSVLATEGAARDGGGATSRELSLAPALGSRRAGAPSAHGPNPPPSQHRERGEGGGAAASAVRSRLGPNCDLRNTIETRRWAESLDNHHDNRSRHHDDRGRGRRHDSDDHRDRRFSLNQRGPRAFG
jgi:hypothetical protein